MPFHGIGKHFSYTIEIGVCEGEKDHQDGIHVLVINDREQSFFMGEPVAGTHSRPQIERVRDRLPLRQKLLDALIGFWLEVSQHETPFREFVTRHHPIGATKGRDADPIPLGQGLKGKGLHELEELLQVVGTCYPILTKCVVHQRVIKGQRTRMGGGGPRTGLRTTRLQDDDRHVPLYLIGQGEKTTRILHAF